MFKKILIANRGEIAVRVMKTCQRLGIKTVAVYSDADADAVFALMADERVHIGAAPAAESYLVADKIIDAAKQTGAEAIHPGYGFLSENADFAKRLKEEEIAFIGPNPHAIEAMGDKITSKKLAADAGVSTVPGYMGIIEDPKEAVKIAEDIGFPVMLKASAGGGGKGMRIAHSADEVEQGIISAQNEARSSFGDDRVFIEKFIEDPRHIEIQVLGDKHGNVIFLGERECSIQRRHQKVIEEAPAPGLTDETRRAMGEAAVRAAQAIDYRGAGTVEFLLDVDGAFFFMEMNTRLQVEHPVTEMITGQDLVEWQLRVAAGEALPLTQSQVEVNGHAFEARIYAEDPDRDFLPATGTLTYLQAPEESDLVRVDTGVRQGDEVSIHYDPMIAKLIVWDRDRSSALRQLAMALSHYRVAGVTTNIDFLYNIATSAPFQQVQLDTHFIEEHRDLLFQGDSGDEAQEIALASLFLLLSRRREAEREAEGHGDP